MWSLVIELMAKAVEGALLGMRQLAAGGRVASAFKVRCILSCLPFCCGLPGSISSGIMPRRINQAERVERRARETVAKGTPLSVRIRCGKPNS